MEDNNIKLDNELTDLTDALMAGREMNPSTDAKDLDAITRQLYQLLASDAAPKPAYRARLTQRLNEEWNAVHRQPPVRQFPSKRVLQVGALAAALIIILVVALQLLPRTNTPVQGTVGLDGLPMEFVLFFIGFIVAVIVAFLVWRRRQ